MAKQAPVEDRADTAGQKDEDEPNEKSINRNLKHYTSFFVTAPWATPKMTSWYSASTIVKSLLLFETKKPWLPLKLCVYCYLQMNDFEQDDKDKLMIVNFNNILISNVINHRSAKSCMSFLCFLFNSLNFSRNSSIFVSSTD